MHIEVSLNRSVLQDPDSAASEDELCALVYKEFVESEEIKLLRKDFQIIDLCMNEIANLADSGWKIYSDKGNSKIYYK